MFDMKFGISHLVFLSMLFGAMPVRLHAGEFGRLFTTPQERAYLDRLRKRGPEIAVDVRNDGPDNKFELEIEDEPRDPITLKGVVYRGRGNSTAWINESNSYASDQDPKDFKMKERNIGKDKVTVELPADNERLRIKVGETYDPNTGRLNDLIDAGQGGMLKNGRSGE